jgi:phosphoglycerate dehydrogenase-like enzyme
MAEDTSRDPDIAVLRQGVHGMPVEEYAAELRERLPDREVAVAHTPVEERDLVETAPVVTDRSIDADLVEHADGLELFACAYAGYDHLPLDALAAGGVAVTTAAGVHAPNVAEHAVGSILSFSRGFHRAARQQRNREWRHFQVGELKGSTVTVVGTGAIGTAIVDRLAAFDVTTIGVRRHPEQGSAADATFGPDALHEALGRSEYVVLACPLTEATRGLLGTEAFTTMHPDAVVVNVARGPVIDTDALVAALRGNEIGGAALDVTDPEPLPEDHPLWGFDNVRITPHNAGHTPAYYERLADILARNLERVDETGTHDDLENQVDLSGYG